MNGDPASRAAESGAPMTGSGSARPERGAASETDAARVAAEWLRDTANVPGLEDQAVEADLQLTAALDALLAERDQAWEAADRQHDIAETHRAARAAAEARAERARQLLKRLSEWDHMQTAADGPYWLREIEAELAETASAPVARSGEGEGL